MKATGVVRRIDDLGRIVIPKEIRKILRIKEGTPLEIFTEKEGDIILKKYSPMSELSTFSSEYVECLSKVTNYIAIVTDKDCVISVCGMPKKDILEESISEKLEKIIDNRKPVILEPENFIQITSKKVLENSYEIIIPILSFSEIIGSIIIIPKDKRIKLTDSDLNIAKVAASFLGTQMEI